MALTSTPSQYATPADLANLGVSANALAPLGMPQQIEALQAASAELDGRMGDQFVYPLLTWGYDIVNHTCEIAAWYLLKARGFNPQNGLDLAIRRGYEDACAWADKVANGTYTPAGIMDSSGGAPAGRPQVVSNAPLNSMGTQYRGF